MTVEKSESLSGASVDTAVFEARQHEILELTAQMRSDEARIAQGGGAAANERQHEKGRLTARERIAGVPGVSNQPQGSVEPLQPGAALGPCSG